MRNRTPRHTRLLALALTLRTRLLALALTFLCTYLRAVALSVNIWVFVFNKNPEWAGYPVFAYNLLLPCYTQTCMYRTGDVNKHGRCVLLAIHSYILGGGCLTLYKS